MVSFSSNLPLFGDVKSGLFFFFLMTPVVRKFEIRSKISIHQIYTKNVTYAVIIFVICGIILQLHLAALASLRAEISELNTRLQSVTEERDILETALKKSQVSNFVLVF